MASKADTTALRRVGAAIGVAGGPAAGYGAWWGGIGDGRLHVAVLATLLAALLGWLTWPVFHVAEADPARPGPGFAALFAASVGLLAGAFAAFPLGAIFGSGAGLLGGAVAALLVRGARRAGAAIAPLVAACGGVGAGLAAAWWLAS